MSSLRVSVAGVTIEITCPHRIAKKGFDNYITDCKADYYIDISKEDIASYRQRYDPILGNWQGHIKQSRMLEKIAQCLIEKDTLLMHGAVISAFGSAYLFSAPSGTGKTTHILKWLERIPNAFVVNGDKPFLKFIENGVVLACGSPWSGKEHMNTNTMVPLKSIILMKRAEDNHIEQISFAEAFPFLLQQVYRPSDEDQMRRTLRLMQRLTPTVSFYQFQCNNFKSDCFDIAYNMLLTD